MKKEFIKLSAILCIITLVAALLLAGVNKITAPRIVQAEKAAAEQAMKKILPDADSFEQLNENVYLALQGDKQVGFCVKVLTNGYGGNISMMVGIDSNAAVQGIEILSHGETAGLGAKITEEKFKSQFRDKKPVLEVVKNETDNPNQITAITGATISSRAIAAGIEQSIALIEEAVKGVQK